MENECLANSFFNEQSYCDWGDNEGDEGEAERDGNRDMLEVGRDDVIVANCSVWRGVEFLNVMFQ